MYSKGEGVAQDDVLAANWYNKAANAGHSNAQLILGIKCAKGIGISKDLEQAYFWWILSSAHGNQSAIANRNKVEKILTATQQEKVQTNVKKWISN